MAVSAGRLHHFYLESSLGVLTDAGTVTATRHKATCAQWASPPLPRAGPDLCASRTSVPLSNSENLGGHAVWCQRYARVAPPDRGAWLVVHFVRLGRRQRVTGVRPGHRPRHGPAILPSSAPVTRRSRASGLRFSASG